MRVSPTVVCKVSAQGTNLRGRAVLCRHVACQRPQHNRLADSAEFSSWNTLPHPLLLFSTSHIFCTRAPFMRCRDMHVGTGMRELNLSSRLIAPRKCRACG